jgi:hypothetical protein
VHGAAVEVEGVGSTDGLGPGPMGSAGPITFRARTPMKRPAASTIAVAPTASTFTAIRRRTRGTRDLGTS